MLSFFPLMGGNILSALIHVYFCDSQWTGAPVQAVTNGVANPAGWRTQPGLLYTWQISAK